MRSPFLTFERTESFSTNVITCCSWTTYGCAFDSADFPGYDGVAHAPPELVSLRADLLEF